MSNIVTGIDIGGSHITAALIDLDKHAIIEGSVVRKRVNSKGSAEEIIAAWCEGIASCNHAKENLCSRIGIAMPGPFDYEKGISKIKGVDKFEALYDLNIRQLLSSHLSVAPSNIHFMNDATCFLKGEVFGGAAQNAKRAIGITLGTGLGSAAFKDGKFYEGDLYFTPYKDANAEDYVSTRWCVNEYFKRTGEEIANTKELSKLAETDVNAASLLEDFGKNLGEVLAIYIEKHQPELVVIGGNVIGAWECFIPSTINTLLENHISLPLVKSLLGEEAALLGAGSLCVASPTTLHGN